MSRTAVIILLLAALWTTVFADDTQRMPARSDAAAPKWNSDVECWEGWHTVVGNDRALTCVPDVVLKCSEDVRCAGEHHLLPRDADRSWHVLIVTHGGTVTLLRDLTEDEAKHTAAKLLGIPYTDEEKAAANAKAADERKRRAKCDAAAKWANGYLSLDCAGYFSVPTAADVKSAEAFQ